MAVYVLPPGQQTVLYVLLSLLCLHFITGWLRLSDEQMGSEHIAPSTGVLKWKKAGEEALKESGLPYTIIRPGRLTDGPYTSYDLNTLLQAPPLPWFESIQRAAGTNLVQRVTTIVKRSSDETVKRVKILSLDHITLMAQATSGVRRDVQVSAKDDQIKEASRIAVAGDTIYYVTPLCFVMMHVQSALTQLAAGASDTELREL